VSNHTPSTPLQKSLRWLTVAIIVMYVVLVAFVGGALTYAQHERGKIQAVVSDTNGALCTLRGDLEARVASSQKFLRDHPDGIPGIEPATIRQSIANTQATVDALAAIPCPASLP
jgi:hypothetical protein